MPQIAQVNPRYVSFNVEAIEITGGRFWKPFSSVETVQNPHDTGSRDPYEYRPPINLSNPKLRKLALGLSPSYIRVSGTWRNSVYFQDDDNPPRATPPAGFKSVMTRAQWKGVLDFARATGAQIVTSVTISNGVRDGDGVWQPDQAKALLDFTKASGSSIAAAEFMNEPTFASAGSAPKGYDAAMFARDVKLFKQFLTANSPQTQLLGPGGIGEGLPMVAGIPLPKMISSQKILQDTGPLFDAFSYHFYTTLSQRCVGTKGLSWEKVLTPEYLNRNLVAEQFYAQLRDTYLPGKPIWLTETGEAGCGGDRWASSFVDSFRFADQLGLLARRNVQTVMVNTLASSDYGLLDENTLEPRPDYWLALLWKRLMGSRILDVGVVPDQQLRVYGQCTKGIKGAVTMLVLNLNQHQPDMLTWKGLAEQYTLTADDLLDHSVKLNGSPLRAGVDGTLPLLHGTLLKAGHVELPPASITFLVIQKARNKACSTL